MNECVCMFTCVVLVILSALSHVHGVSRNTSESCGELFKNGVEAYLESRFQDCVVDFEAAIAKYRTYKNHLQHCRIKCAKESADSEYLYPVDVENLHFYESAVRNTFCILRCKQRQKNVFGKYNLDMEVETNFEQFKPYEYLHICYFQTSQTQKASSAAFTYLVAHPDDEATKKSLRYYSSFPEVNANKIINFEAKEYIYLYTHGVQAYQQEEWRAVVDYMEESLASFLDSEEQCRADCEGPFVQGWFPDFIPSIANHFTYTLRCKRRCYTKLSSLNGDIREQLLPNHYHYLQFAYYKLGKIKACIQAAVSYLLFFPDDETMLSNIEFYGELPEVKEDYFKPRVEAIKYIRRENYEDKLMDYIDSFSLEQESVILSKDIVALKEINLSMDSPSLEQTNDI